MVHPIFQTVADNGPMNPPSTQVHQIQHWRNGPAEKITIQSSDSGHINLALRDPKIIFFLDDESNRIDNKDY